MEQDFLLDFIKNVMDTKCSNVILVQAYSNDAENVSRAAKKLNDIVKAAISSIASIETSA